MIKDEEKLVKYLVEWCQNRAKEAKVTGAVVGVSGGIDSAVVLALCVKAFPDNTTGVLMPCHSSKSSVARGEELIAKYQGLVERQYINLEESFEDIVSQFYTLKKFDDKFVYGALRSCLRAPVLDFIAKANNALVFGTGNRDEDEIFRYYQKRGDGAVDNNVIACLHKSEVYQLARYLNIPESIIKAKPSADLWGAEEQTDEEELGLTYDEIEWVIREHEAWLVLDAADMDEVLEEYNDREKSIIKKAYEYYRTTKHKENPNIPKPNRLYLEHKGLLE